MPRKKPFKNCSVYITGGNFKNSMASAFSAIEIDEEKEEEKAILKELEKKPITLEELEKSYRKLLKKKKIKKTARKVYFPNYPDLVFISFKDTKTQADWEAAKYFKESYNPNFIGMKTEEIVRLCKNIRIPELDEFSEKGKVPIPTLMQKASITFSCAICGKHHFTYDDYCKNLCFIHEGEFWALPYTNEFVVCYKCHQNLI